MDHSILHSIASPIGFLATGWIDTFKDYIVQFVGNIAIDPLASAMGIVIAIPTLLAYCLIALSVYALEVSIHTNINSEILYNAWQMSIYVVNILAVFFLIILAFANALRINIETYEIKKTLPNFIISIVLANLSFLFCKLLLDFSDLLVMGIQEIYKSDIGLAAQLMQVTTGIEFKPLIVDNAPVIIGGVKIALPTLHQNVNFINSLIGVSFIGGWILILAVPGAGPIIGIVVLLLEFLILIIPALILAFLALLSLARQIVIFILIALMPILIVLYFFPPTKQHGEKLIGEFFQWVFLAPAIYFLLGLATLFTNDNIVTIK